VNDSRLVSASVFFVTKSTLVVTSAASVNARNSGSQRAVRFGAARSVARRRAS